MATAKNGSSCIFCRSDTWSSRSIEHIIPESLGNKEHVLPPGVVCDACNNYFARKVEGRLLESTYFKHLRSMMLIPNKRRRVPPVQAMMPHVPFPVEVLLDGSNLHIGSPRDAEQLLIERVILSGKARSVYIPLPAEIDESIMSRFVAKVALEALAGRIDRIPDWRAEILSETFDPLRDFARYGRNPAAWQFKRRSLYEPRALFSGGDEYYEIPHEFDFVYVSECALFFVMALFGEEFTIDMTSPSIDRYEAWLVERHGVSPLAPWPTSKV